MDAVGSGAKIALAVRSKTFRPCGHLRADNLPSRLDP
jgi:hypothetical protein